VNERWLLLACAVAVYASGVRLVVQLVATRAEWLRPRVPRVATGLLVVTLATNLWQLSDGSVVGSLGRNPGDLADGRAWKLVSPLLVQADGMSQFVSNTLAFLLVVPLAELALGSVPVAVLYLAGGLAGQATGFAWYDHGGGNSVAIAGVYGGLAALSLTVPRARWASLPLAVAGVTLSLAHDNHGPAIVTGVLVGLALIRLDRTGPLPQPNQRKLGTPPGARLGT
jgi:membrane associated rhomboid family serine protease